MDTLFVYTPFVFWNMEAYRNVTPVYSSYKTGQSKLKIGHEDNS